VALPASLWHSGIGFIQVLSTGSVSARKEGGLPFCAKIANARPESSDPFRYPDVFALP
jgi:hypothetical protein